MPFRVTYDPVKRAATFAERGLDFEDAAEVFAGDTIEFADERADYSEARIITVGYLRGRMVIVLWTERGGTRRIISMRKPNEREQIRFGQRFGEG